MAGIDVQAVKKENEAIILQAGGRICDWLPSPDATSPLRDPQAIARRTLVVHAMLQIAFQAPVPFIRQWIRENGLDADLAESERLILDKSNENLTEQEQTNLFWYIEALWAFVWAQGFVAQLPFDQPVGDNLASLMPDLQRNESGTEFLRQAELRSHDELFRMLDLYYRVHWWTRDANLRGQQTGDVRVDIIRERRKALEWMLDTKNDWDCVEMST